MRKVVLDTNILVSALWLPTGNPYKIVDMFTNDKIVLYYSGLMADEYRNVLRRPKFNFPLEEVSKLLDYMCRYGILIEPVPSTIPMIDETDRKFYDTAKTAGSILVTGNTKHYPSEKFVVSPADFIALSK